MCSIIRTILILVVIYTTFRPFNSTAFISAIYIRPSVNQMLSDEGHRVQPSKRCINNNQDEDSPNNTTHTNNTSSQKYRDRFNEVIMSISSL